MTRRTNVYNNTASATYYVTDRAYDASTNSWCCYLCERTFTAASDLNQHLNSRRHEQVTYHCPNHHCRMDSVRLSGVLNHLESGACGFMRFGQVLQLAESMLDPNSRRLFSVQ